MPPSPTLPKTNWTIRKVGQTLQELGLCIPRSAVDTLITTYRDQFIACLDGAISPSSSIRDIAVRQLKTIAACETEEKIVHLRNLGLSASLHQLAGTAFSYPSKLLSAIEITSDVTHPKYQDAIAYLKSVLIYPARELPKASETSDQDKPKPTGPYLARKTVHVYGGSGALCFNAVEGLNGRPGIMVDSAKILGPKNYDWANASHFMLDDAEVGSVLAVLRSWKTSTSISGHGKRHEKVFSIETQGKHFYCKVLSRELGIVGVPVLPDVAARVAMLFMEQVLLTYPSVPAGEVLDIIRTANCCVNRTKA